MVTTQVRFNPFPGLRPFEVDETHLFFGREGQADELLRRLGRNRLLAVVGTSGSGKSSLVRAGLLPSLYNGFMVQAGSSWRVAVFRPGDDPIGNLARALNHPKVFGMDSEDDVSAIITETTLRRGALGLIEVVQQARMPSDDNLLVVVDQFEELFRFKQNALSKDSGDEAAAFVKLLLEATQQKVVPIYVAITMRSDFLGDCAQFRDLPEALNDSQYLVPRMTRDQRCIAIEGPCAVGGAKMTKRLVNRLLNDMGDNPDQLPILQHALMRTWDYWAKNHQDGEAIDLYHYEAIGSMAKALSQHGDEIYKGLPDIRCQKIAEKLFKCLTEKTFDDRGIRRPTKLQEICDVAEAESAEVINIVEQFRAPGCSFLMPPVGTRLNENSVLDISHESLMRGWQRLEDWVEEESQAAQIYRRLAETAILYRERRAGLWRDPELTIATKWLKKNRPNAAWAKRYNPVFEQAMNFLKESTVARDREIAEKEKARHQAEAIKRQRLIIVSVAAGFLIATLLSIFAFGQHRHSEKSEIEARTASSKARLVLNRGFDALMESLKAGAKLKRRLGAETETTQEVMTALQQAISEVNEFNRLESHTDGILKVSFSPDGKTLATASRDKTVKLWSLDGTLLTTLKGHEDAVTHVSFSRDGKTLATASRDKTVKLWSTNGILLKTLKESGASVYSVAFSPDGQILASASRDRTVKLWRRDGTLVTTLTGHSDAVTSVRFSPDGQTIATAGSDTTVRLWNRNGKELSTLRGHSDAVNGVSFSPDGQVLATASYDNTIKLWKRNGTLEKTLKGHSDAVTDVSFSPDGQFLATASSDKTVKLWRVDGTLLKTFEGHSDAVTDVSFSPDGKTLASASLDKTVKLWRLNNEFFTSLLGHKASVTGVSCSPDGQLLASTSSDKTVKLWNPACSDKNAKSWSEGGTLLMTLTGHSDTVTGVSLSLDSQLLATASFDGTVKLWKRDGTLLKTLSGHKAGINRVVFSPNGQSLATASSDRTVKLWRRDGTLLKTLSGHSDAVNDVNFSLDGKILATASRDQTVKLWSTRGELLMTLTGHKDAVNGVSFSPDGKLIATASRDQTVKLWSTRGELLTTLTGHKDAVNGVSFSPDGKLIATASSDKTIKLWKLDGTLVTTLTGHSDAVNGVSFSPDGKLLASASADRTVILRDLDNPNSKLLINPSLEGLLKRGCDWVHYYLKNNPSVSESDKALCD
jgi:WD40 repeat protein/energy-coupling factor transporter ATP-binding protein EcfA2